MGSGGLASPLRPSLSRTRSMHGRDDPHPRPKRLLPAHPPTRPPARPPRRPTCRLPRPGSVSARPAGLLVVGLHGCGAAPVHDAADVGLVDAHACASKCVSKSVWDAALRGSGRHAPRQPMLRHAGHGASRRHVAPGPCCHRWPRAQPPAPSASVPCRPLPTPTVLFHVCYWTLPIRPPPPSGTAAPPTVRH